MKKDQFWRFVHEREKIRRRKEGGMRQPWTSDERLQRYWFPNIDRERDRTNHWFRAMVRDVVEDRQALLLAVVTFRLFSRIEIGELLLPMLTTSGYSRNTLLRTLGPTRESLFNQRLPVGMLPRGLDQAVRVLDRFEERLDEYSARLTDFSLEHSHRVLSHATGIGPSLAYEIVCDLRRTEWIPHPIDSMTWAAPTPAACEAASFMLGTELRHTRSEDRYLVIAHMKDLLRESRFAAYDFVNDWEMSEAHRALTLFHTWARKAKPNRRYHKWNS